MTTCHAASFFFSLTISLSRSCKWSNLLVNIEGFQRNVDDAVRTKHDHETNESPINGLSPGLSSLAISSILYELKHTPEECDESTSYEKQNDWIYNLFDDLCEKLL